MIGDALVAYEYCNVQIYLSDLVRIANMDYSYWASLVSRGVVFMINNFQNYMERISLVDGTRCVVAAAEADLEENYGEEEYGGEDFGVDVDVDPNDISPMPASGRAEYYYTNGDKDTNQDLMIDCVPNQFELGKIWGQLFAAMTGESIVEEWIMW